MSRRDSSDRLGDLVAKHPKKIVTFFLLLFVASLPALGSLTSFISLYELLPAGDYFEANEILNEELGADNVMFVLTTPQEAGIVTEVDALREVDHILTRLEDVEYVQSTVSLPGLVKTLNFLMTGQYEMPPDNPVGDQQTEQLFQQALSLYGEALIYDNVLSRDHGAGVALIVMDKGYDLQTYRDWQVELKEKGLELDAANPYALQTTNEPISIDVIYADLDNVAVAEGPLWVATAAVVAVISAYFILSRRGWDTAFAMFVLVVSIGVTVSAGFLLGVHFNLLTILMVALILAIGIDYAMHVIARYQEERSLGYDAQEAIRQATRHVGSALFITMVTTVAGFVSLYFSRIQAIGQFGIMVGAGMLTAYLACILLLPALVQLQDLRRQRKGTSTWQPIDDPTQAEAKRAELLAKLHEQQANSGMGKFAAWNQRNALGVFIVCMVVLGSMGMTIAVKGVDLWGASYIDPPILDEDTYPMRVLTNIDEAIGIPVEGAILVQGDMTRPATLDYLEAIEDQMLGRVPCADQAAVQDPTNNEVCYDPGPRDHGILNGMSTVSIVKLLYPTLGIPSNAQEDQWDIDSDGDGQQDACLPGADQPCGDGIPDSSAALRRFYDRIYEMPTVQGVAYRVVSEDYDFGVVRYNYAAQPVESELNPAGSLGADIDNYFQSYDDLRASVQIVQDEYDSAGAAYPTTYPATGLLVSAIEVNQAIDRGNTLSTYAMIVTTFVMIFIFWQRVGPTLLTMIPVVVAVTVQYFIIAAMEYEVTYVSIILTGMALGVGIDDAVHLVNRFKEEMTKGVPARQAAILANSEVGRVLMATTLTTISPFIVIIGSVIAWAKNTAWMTIPTLASALLATVFLLPILLRWHGERWPNAWVTKADRRKLEASHS